MQFNAYYCIFFEQSWNIRQKRPLAIVTNSRNLFGPGLVILSWLS